MLRDEPYPAALTDELLAGPRRRQRPRQFVLEPAPAREGVLLRPAPERPVARRSVVLLGLHDAAAVRARVPVPGMTKSPSVRRGEGDGV
ncbi:hypothetical protein [Streptomyces sp. CPS1]